MFSILKKYFIFIIVLVLTGCNSSNDTPNDSPNITDENLNKISELRINVESPEMEVGESQELTLTAIWNNGKEKDITENIKWSVGDDSASLNETTGKLKAKSPSIVNVTATFSQITTEKQIIINPSSLQSINLEKISSATPICQETQLIAMGVYADGSTKDISKYVRWDIKGKDQFKTINLREMNEVSNNRFLMSSQFPDTVTITATYNYDYFNPQDSINSSKDIDITDNISKFEIENIYRDKSIVLGQAGFIRTQTTYDDGSSVFGSTPSWSSSNPKVAKASNYNGTQNNAGVVTTLSEGTTTITAECGTHQASTEVTVTSIE